VFPDLKSDGTRLFQKFPKLVDLCTGFGIPLIRGVLFQFPQDLHPFFVGVCEEVLDGMHVMLDECASDVALGGYDISPDHPNAGGVWQSVLTAQINLLRDTADADDGQRGGKEHQGEYNSETDEELFADGQISHLRSFLLVFHIPDVASIRDLWLACSNRQAHNCLGAGSPYANEVRCA
jgi:hypothetical protein